jgi:hypothetical protein
MSALWTLALVLAQSPEIAATEVTGAGDAVANYHAIAMMPLSSLGSTDESVDAVEQLLQGELNKLLGERLILPDALHEQPEHIRTAFHTCEGVVACLVEVMGGLGWDAFIVGNLAGLGERRVINLKLIDVHSGSEVRRASEKASGDESQLIVNIRKAAVQLVAPHLFTGDIELVASQSNVTVQLDGKLLGVTPLAQTRVSVPAGHHALEASGEGLVPFSTMLTIAYGETKTVTVDLAQSTAFMGGSTPFRHRWWTWAIAGAGLVAVGLGSYFNYLQVDTVNTIERRAGNDNLGAGSADLYQQQQDHWTRAVVFYGSGSALLTTAGVLLIIDLF